MQKNGYGKFNGRVQDYSASRPDYPEELTEYLFKNSFVGNTVADIGSGTGKFTEQLLKRNIEVFAVEPNGEMRSESERRLGKNPLFHMVDGTAENTTLLSNSVETVTVAQAFHWFDGEKFKKECERIIKKHGKFILVWNVREDGEVNENWQAVFKKYCPEFNGFSNGITEEKIRNFFRDGCKVAKFEHPLYFTRENFIKRSLSSSCSLKQNDTLYGEYLTKLNSLFDRYEKDGVVRIDNRTVAYVGEIRSLRQEKFAFG